MCYLVSVGLSIPYESFDSGAEALAAGIAAVSKYGGARAGYRTMLDALIPALSVLEEVLAIAVHFLYYPQGIIYCYLLCFGFTEIKFW